MCMKTALDTLMEALETDTWTPPIAPTIREEASRGVHRGVQQPFKDHGAVSREAPIVSHPAAEIFQVLLTKYVTHLRNGETR